MRNELLRLMRFRSYAQYCRSKLWKSIREAKLAEDPKCYGCGKPANSVHHGEYTWDNLRGKSDEHLYSICAGCHHRIEFSGRRKRTPFDATQVLQRMHLKRLRAKKPLE